MTVAAVHSDEAYDWLELYIYSYSPSNKSSGSSTSIGEAEHMPYLPRILLENCPSTEPEQYTMNGSGPGYITADTVA